jgi:hypothetical protein
VTREPHAGISQQLRLVRTARVAGEAFAFADADSVTRAPALSWRPVLTGLAVALLAATAYSVF